MNRFRCEVCCKEDTSIFHCDYCGGYFCAEHHLPENHNCPNKPPPKNEATTNSEDSICIECKTKLNDGTLKNVTNCPYCQRPMCNSHLRPKPIFIPDFKDTGKRYKEIQEIIEKDLRADDGHPCLPYTKIFWKEYEKRQERYKKQLEQLVHKPLFAYRKEEELEEAPYEPLIKKSYFKETNKTSRRKIPLRKLIALFLIIIVFVVALQNTSVILMTLDRIKNLFLSQIESPLEPIQTPTPTPAPPMPTYKPTPIPTPTPMPTSTRLSTTICFEGFSVTQNGTHLIIEDYSSEWAPQYSISLKNGTRLFNLVPYKVEGDAIIAEYAYISRNYTKEIYSLNEISRRLPLEYSAYIFEIYTHDRRYDFILDSGSPRILFGDYSHVYYLPSISLGNTIYDVILKDFNETVFQRIKESVFTNISKQDDALSRVWHLVEWVDLNIKYEFSKFLPYIYDPLTFMEMKIGVCIDYAVFYVAGIFTIGFDEAYVLTFNTSRGGHAVAGIAYNQSMLILEQKLPMVELQDYIEFSEIILNASVHMPIYAYKIEHMDGDFVIEFFELDSSKYMDTSPLDGLTYDFVKDIELSLSQKLKASVTNTKLFYSLKWSWENLRFYTNILHTQWVEYISNIITKQFIKGNIKPRYLNVDKADSTTLLIHYD
ncbi:MAG: transglutaminase-like domain-containing protein [Nitrososphaeria archaeon]